MWTGDEMGYINKWDLSVVVEKLENMRPAEDVDEADIALKQKLMSAQKATFLTGMGGEKEDESGFKPSDVKKIVRWKAHSDLIN
jgi:hypothetical protein